MTLFATKEWTDEYCNALNENPAYEDAAKTWEGDFVFVVLADEISDQDAFFWVDLWHGKARDWAVLESADEKPDAVFVFSGPYKNFKALVGTPKLDPIQGLMTGKFKLKGDMAKVMRAVKAAQELVNQIVSLGTEFL
ncbi:MAG TPA: SCP2 sterol-binding domain-containing protein [Candidatus Lokiarchaeia archaeon]|nr:SCP2 sterol-binding domain-containing protein [Candidatus Lokiarchaeia archaeon]